MQDRLLERPIVHVSSFGTASVKAADILRSRIGQEEISKAAAVAVELHLRQPSENGATGKNGLS